MTHQAVRSVSDIRSCGTLGIVEIVLVDGSRIVRTECLVVIAVLLVKLLQARTVFGAFGTVSDHLEDTAGRVLGIERDAVVTLHQARVVDSIVSLSNT